VCAAPPRHPSPEGSPAATAAALVETLLLRDVLESDYSGIAELLDIPLGRVKSRIHSAHQIVQPLLAVR
jgi:DNA-directed RNA polymerase specialized sigma24 family protein